jgi:hypothetical protein
MQPDFLREVSELHWRSAVCDGIDETSNKATQRYETQERVTFPGEQVWRHQR